MALKKHSLVEYIKSTTAGVEIKIVDINPITIKKIELTDEDKFFTLLHCDELSTGKLNNEIKLYEELMRKCCNLTVEQIMMLKQMKREGFLALGEVLEQMIFNDFKRNKALKENMGV